MGDIRNLNSFFMPGGFNITSAEPMDSREFVNDINDIYLDSNWVKVKPYPGLQVISADGQVRICINTDYTKQESWINPNEGTGSVQVDTYTDAVALATSDNLGQIIYVKEETTITEGETSKTYIAGPYIVTGSGTISYLSSTTPGETDEVTALKSRVDTIEGRVNDLEAEHENFVTKEEGKGLSTNDYTDDDKAKLDGIAEGAQVNVIETIKVNGAALTPDENKVVDITIEAPAYNTTINVTDGVVENGDNAPTSTAVYDYVETVKNTVNDLITDLEGKVNAIETWKLQVLTEDQVGEDGLPTGLTEISHKTIYLAPNKSESTGNIYNEFIYLDGGSWEKLGEFKADFDPTGLNKLIEGLGTRIGNIETQLANYDTLVSDVDNLKNTINDPESGLAKVKEIADGAAKKATDNELNLTNNYYTKGETEEKIAEIVTGGTIELTGYVKFEDVAVANTYGGDGSITVAGKNGTMSVADKEKLDSISTMTEEDIDKILIGETV